MNWRPHAVTGCRSSTPPVVAHLHHGQAGDPGAAGHQPGHRAGRIYCAQGSLGQRQGPRCSTAWAGWTTRRGSVKILGQEIGRWNERKLTLWRRAHVGFIFQSLGLMPTLSAYENVELILRILNVSRRERDLRTRAALDLVGLTPWIDHRPFEMSGGQQQRVAIARALVTEPALILADEPTGELDSKTATEILTLFQTLVHERGMTILMATHDSLVDEFVDKVMHLQDGAIVEVTKGTPLDDTPLASAQPALGKER
ncbi:MAG: ABC transporter ATP-binding protein [Caldilineaceae bacterium]